MHVNVGDCIAVDSTNQTDGPVSFHADMLAYDPKDSGGIEAGNNPPQAAAPGQSRSYTFFASPEVGETVAMVRDWGDVTENPGLGLYGAIVVGPEGAGYRDPVTDEDVSLDLELAGERVPGSGGRTATSRSSCRTRMNRLARTACPTRRRFGGGGH